MKNHGKDSRKTPASPAPAKQSGNRQATAGDAGKGTDSRKGQSPPSQEAPAVIIRPPDKPY